MEEQQGLARGPPTAPSELTDAVEPGEQGLAVERYRGRWPIDGWFRHRVKIERVRTRRKGTHRVGTIAIDCNGGPPTSILLPVGHIWY